MTEEFSGAKILKGIGMYGIFIFLAAFIREVNVDWLNLSTMPEDLKIVASISLLLIGLSFLVKYGMMEALE